jgi:hypothetical protein
MRPREEFESLAHVVPGNPERLLSDCEQRVTSVRDSFLLKQRQLVILQLADPAIRPHFFPSADRECYELLQRDIKVLEDVIAPQHLQFVYKLYDHFVHNLGEIVKVTINVLRRPVLLPFFAYSVIPSFFGYFSSQEHLSYAFSFYCALVAEAPEGITDLFLRPFFCNACTHRYIEAVTSDVITFFCQDIRLAANHGNAFLTSILRHLRFLPTTHVNILRILQRAWPAQTVFRFFVDRFITPQLTIHLVCSPLSAHLDSLKELIASAFKVATDFAISSLFRCSSIFEVPPAFGTFSDPCMIFVTTPFDVSMFLEMLDNSVELPRILSIL